MALPTAKVEREATAQNASSLDVVFMISLFGLLSFFVFGLKD